MLMPRIGAAAAPLGGLAPSTPTSTG